MARESHMFACLLTIPYFEMQRAPSEELAVGTPEEYEQSETNGVPEQMPSKADAERRGCRAKQGKAALESWGQDELRDM